ncbi:radical SAM/SPASM domain-containing protein [Vibrio tubiashii]|nr:radical SAM protein [Vibrio tubiashii]
MLANPEKPFAFYAAIDPTAEPSDVDYITSFFHEMGISSETVESLNNEVVEGSLSAPTRVFFDYTYYCPEKCKHCFTNSGYKREQELSFEQKTAIVDQLVEIGCYRISVAGGEPLADKTFISFVRYCKEKGVDVSLSTSGIPSTKSLAHELSALDVRTINISLDGWDAASYDCVRGEGRFDLMRKRVATLRKHYRGKLAAKVTLMTTNIHNLRDIIHTAREMELDVVKFNCVREAGRAEDNSSLVPSRAEYIEAMQELAKIKYEYEQDESSLGITLSLPVNPYSYSEEGGIQSTSSIESLGFGCYAGKESFCISPIGEIQPCSAFGPGNYSDGLVTEHSIQEVWREGNALNAFRALTGDESCHECPSYSACKGGCHLRSLYATGKLDGLDPYCFEHDVQPIAITTV